MNASVALLLAALAVATAEPIVATRDPGSDCVAAKISTDRTPAHREFDERYCSVNKDAALYAACLGNLAQDTSIAFFTDRCYSEEQGAFISFNGDTHHVFRHGPAPASAVHYAGTWRGKDGLEVRVVPVRLLSQQYDPDAGHEAVAYEVDVHVRLGERSATIRGYYDNSW